MFTRLEVQKANPNPKPNLGLTDFFKQNLILFQVKFAKFTCRLFYENFPAKFDKLTRIIAFRFFSSKI